MYSRRRSPGNGCGGFGGGIGTGAAAKSLAFHPVIVGGHVLIADAARVFAFDQMTGKLVSEYRHGDKNKLPETLDLRVPSRTDVTPARPGVIHQHWSEPVNGQHAEGMNEGGVMIERRSGKDRREHPLGSALFAGPERRTGVFGRRPVDTYDTSGRK